MPRLALVLIGLVVVGNGLASATHNTCHNEPPPGDITIVDVGGGLLDVGVDTLANNAPNKGAGVCVHSSVTGTNVTFAVGVNPLDLPTLQPNGGGYRLVTGQDPNPTLSVSIRGLPVGNGDYRVDGPKLCVVGVLTSC